MPRELGDTPCPRVSGSLPWLPAPDRHARNVAGARPPVRAQRALIGDRSTRRSATAFPTEQRREASTAAGQITIAL